ncbi:Eco57I restriction-modification methylase domain-containing protein [Mesorhizobium sp. M0923]|uniref:Eco57I restriction-modification methylase domain-containing protein n=1 Tax=unclassified Mesorhizobium TaxID=325217 RepID=UPI0003D06B9F|nr:DNA methyltransferase [Mesorhizobium sp. L48C026A00]ESZ11300.1 hypothetical protein X737_30000 [Mesorhizobium sp. L48C026A00]
MDFNAANARKLLEQFDFASLFAEELGWDRHKAELSVVVSDETFTLRAAAEKRGAVAWVCLVATGSGIPERSVRQKIDREVSKSTFEHLIIFVDASHASQVWSWPRREFGKPVSLVDHVWYAASQNTAFIQRLHGISFRLSEENELTLPKVTARLEGSLNAERVTKRFYDQFTKEHAAFLGFISGIADVADKEWYASLMLNRLMFIYFMQRKGFLDGKPNYLADKLTACQAQLGKDKFHSFYRTFLIRLFHDGLGGKPPRDPELDTLLGRIPYLNGGLFEKHAIEERYLDIKIPDEAFARIFGYFDRYQWHLDERPLRKDDEINPDVLGYIFEKYINQKQMGAYYTKEDITEYISKNTVIPFLFDAAKAECKVAFENPGGPTIWDHLRDDPDGYIYPAVKHGLTWDVHANAALERPLDLPPEIAAGIEDVSARAEWNRKAPAEFGLPAEIWREVVARRVRYAEIRAKLAAGEVREINDLITLNLDIWQFAQDVIERSEGSELVRAFWKAIEGVTVLDPTCGSGAFLFAALKILQPLYEACLDRMQEFVLDHERVSGKVEDRPKGFRAVLDNIKKHPNRQYFILKSIILKNLFGVDIMEEAVEICKLRLFLKLAAQVDADQKHENLGIEPLPDIDFNIRAGNTLVGYATYADVKKALTSKLDLDNSLEKITTSAADLQQTFDAFRRRQVEGDGSVPAADKAELRARLKNLEVQLNVQLASSYGKARAGDALEGWVKTHQPFHWFIEFYGIMHNGGFDVLIGNPPYVEYRKVKQQYTLPRDTYSSESAANLYAFCMERSCDLVRANGRFGMIVPTAVLGLDETEPLRAYLTQELALNWCSTFAIRPSKLFDGVDQRLCIWISEKSRSDRAQIWTTRYHHWYAEERESLFSCIGYTRSFVLARLNRIVQLGSNDAARVLEKIERGSAKTIAHYLRKSPGGALLHYHRSPRYWIRGMDFEQYFRSETKARSVHHFRDIHVFDAENAKFVGSIINSTLFFFWFVSVGNGRNITSVDVSAFPVGNIERGALRTIGPIFDRLMADYKANSIIRVRKDCEFQEFRPSQSKGIIDELDRKIARHFGFEASETDFIVNYDVKYRMGQSDGDDEADDDE